MDQHLIQILTIIEVNSGQEENSLFINPLLSDPENDNPNLEIGSPSIDRGVNYEYLITGNVDYYGNERIINDLIDIGAVEFNNITSTNTYESNVENIFKLLPAYPNPFNPSTTIIFEVPIQNSRLKYLLFVFDMLGRKLVSKEYNSNGNEQISFTWNAENYESGVYLVVIKSSIGLKSEKIVLIK